MNKVMKRRAVKVIKIIFCVCCLGTSRSDLHPAHKIWPSLDTWGIDKMSDLFKNTFQYALLHMLKYIPWTWEIYKVLAPCKLCYAPDFLKTQEMCNKATRNNPWMLRYVPDHL